MDSPDECSLFLPFVDHVLALSTIWCYLIVLRAGIHYGAFGRSTDCGASRRPYTVDSKHVDVREMYSAEKRCVFLGRGRKNNAKRLQICIEIMFAQKVSKMLCHFHEHLRIYSCL